MAIIPILSPAEQVAAHLRTKLRQGIWKKEIPGAPRLARELRVDTKTALAALLLLENEGLLVSQGVGRRRRINSSAITKKTSALRIAILMSERTDRRVDYLAELQHALLHAGHDAFFVEKTQLELDDDQTRIRRLIKSEAANAWIIISGSPKILNLFSRQALPTFALFGRIEEQTLPGVLPEKIPAYHAAIDTLVNLGHQRLVMLVRKSRRLPVPGRTEQAFLDRLKFHGIPTSPYNLPDWEDDTNGFQVRLEELFRLTPPTALIIQEAFLFSAAYHFLAQQGLRIPEDISMVCSDDDSSFSWWQPAVSHIHWNSEPVIRRVIRWAANVSRGKTDSRQTFTKAEWLEGGTIGPAKA